jgi:hypothetical protein
MATIKIKLNFMNEIILLDYNYKKSKIMQLQYRMIDIETMSSIYCANLVGLNLSTIMHILYIKTYV